MNFKNDKIEYLQMIQSCIDRMSTLSSIFKGFAATLVVGLSVIIELNELAYKVLLVIPLISFSLMDIYYLQLERRFRALYNCVRIGKHKVNFDLSPPQVKRIKNKYKNITIFSCMLSLGILIYYIPLIIIVIIIIFK